MAHFPRDLQFYKFCAYGFLKNLRFFEPFLVLFFLEMGIDYIHIGILMAIREIAVNLLELPSGILADSFGRRKAMIFSFLSYIVSFAVFTFFPHFHFYILAMLLFACGDAFRTGTHKAMILTYLEIKGIKHLKIHYYGTTRSASQLGSALSALLAMILVFFQGSLRWVFLVSVVPYILELFLMISYPRELDGNVKPVSGGLAKAVKERFKETTKQFLALFKKRVTLKALLSSAVFSGLFKGIKDYLQPLLKSYAAAFPLLLSFSHGERTTLLIGTAYFLLFLLTSYASKKSGAFADKLKSLPSGMNKTFLIGVVFLIISGAALEWEFYEISALFFILLYVLQNLRKPVCVGYISEHVSSNIMATGLSGESQLRSLFAALFSFLTGLLVHYAGLSTAIMVIALLGLLCYPLVRITGNR
ncbi:MAG: MFS transporter [bacterium]|nr:MFS transporter [bacterium]